VTGLWVALAGGIGAAARYLVEVAVTAKAGDRFPWGTFVVNVTGCFAAGLLTGPILTTGLVGGYTTFSAYAVQVVKVDAGSRAAAVGYGLGSVVLGVLAAGLGLALR
jgi:CrcB protein